MAYLKYPEPGTELGPCKGGCEHWDCQATRNQAEQPCAVCGGQLGYGVPVQQAAVPDGPRREAHMACNVAQAETGGA